MKVKNDHRSKFSNLSNWKEEAWGASTGFNGLHPVEALIFGHIAAHEKVHFSNGTYKTKNSQLAHKNAKLRSWIERSYSYLRLAARLPELASKLERLSCYHWVCSEYRREYHSKLLTDHSSDKRCNCWRSLRWDDRRSLFNERTLLHSM